jgi:hypothetical protein
MIIATATPKYAMITLSACKEAPKDTMTNIITSKHVITISAYKDTPQNTMTSTDLDIR